MPKLSKTRIINLNYNDGKRTVYNEIFDYGDGKNTLFSMDNGIGKTVIIQFFMQPFIRNKRELAGRKFEDYFLDNAPAYIMHEVLLDNGEKLLVGMVIKRDNSEEDKNRLKIFAFINKYHKPDDFDIINVPFVEGRRILKFSEAEDKIKNYSRGRTNFKYFNFNDSSKKSDYFEELKLYKLDYKEWEDIIRAINNDESGLSNLYDKHKTDEALVRNAIVPLIESKINGEKNIIEAIRNNLSKYVESYKQSKESISEVELLKTFTGEMFPVTELLKQGEILETDGDKLYKRLSGIAVLCDGEFSKKCSEKLQCEEFLNELDGELKKVDYEEHSLNYYNLRSREAELEERHQSAKDEHKKAEDKYGELLKEKYIQESADIYEELLGTEGNLAQVRERIANYEKDDSEIAQSIRNYKFTLKEIYDQDLKSLYEKEKELLGNEKSFNDRLNENEQEQKVVLSEQKKIIEDRADAKNSIGNFEKIEDSFKKSYGDFNLTRNSLLGEYILADLEKYKATLDEKIKGSLDKQGIITKEDTSLLVGKDNLKREIGNTNDEIKLHELEFVSRGNDLERFNVETKKIIEILTIKNLPLRVTQGKEKLRELLTSENNKLQENQSAELAKLREKEDELLRCETGLIQLPKEVLKSFEDKGIEFEYALEFIKKYTGSKEDKENLVKGNPFFPYGILLSAKDIALLKSESTEVFTSIPIPVINKNDLGKQLKIEKSNDIIKIENQEFLMAFNYLLIDDTERAEILNGLRQQIKMLKSELDNIQEAINRNIGHELTLKSYPYNGDEDMAYEVEIKRLKDKALELKEVLRGNNEALLTMEKRREAINKELHELENKLIALNEQKDRFGVFILEHEDYKKQNKIIYELKQLMEALNKKEGLLKENYKEIQSGQRALTIDIHEINNSIRATSIKLEMYKNIEVGILQEEDKNTLEAKLEACEKDLGDNIKRDKQDEKRLAENSKKAKDRLDRKVREGKLSGEYMNISFSEQRLEEINEILMEVLEIVNKFKGEMIELDKQLSLAIDKKQRESMIIEELGYDVPIEKEEIKALDFKDRRKKINEDKRQNGQIIEEYSDLISKLKLIKQRLEYYKSSRESDSIENFDFDNLDAADRLIDEYIKSHQEIKARIRDMESKISKAISSIYEKYRDKNRFIKERLFDFLNKERKISSLSDLESLLEIVDRNVRTLEIELSSIKSEEEIIINEILRYANHVLQELKTIDKKSSIKHMGRTRKLLEISIPEEREEESLKEYIKDRVVYYSNLEGDYLNQLEVDINSAELLSKLIGNTSRIRVYIMKIEKTGLIRKSWKELLPQNSGGEKFVSMFVLLSSLMSYMRKRETDIDNKEEKKILIMDNPFAKTHAVHLLEPMFQIAEKYNIQLLCFSGIGGSAVYNRFNKIYVAKVIEDKFRNKENVSFKAGTEETLELSDFNINREQLSLLQ